MAKIKEILPKITYRIKRDTLEVIWATRRILYPRKKKHFNIWSITALLIVFCLAAALAFPMFAGFINYIFNFNHVDEDVILSTSELTSLIIIAAALGTLILWFTTRSSEDDKYYSNKKALKSCGKLFLVSALSLALFLLLEPLLPSVREQVDLYSNFIRYSIFFSFMIGGMSFIFAVLYSLIFIWIV